MHVAESEAEMQMYARRKGELFDWLAAIRDMSDCGGTTPVQEVHRAGLLGPNLLAAHCNYVTDDDIKLVAKSGSSVVHCPSSHAFFGHRRFPYEKLTRAGVNLCLGTDSMATMRGRELNMLTEMQQFARVYASVSPVQVLQMATINGARALGMKGSIGELKAGASADFVVIPFSGSVVNCEACIFDVTRPSQVIIGGQELKRVI
jgi:cytosine/adenosine deaminase-related metal-dependent hydrolase